MAMTLLKVCTTARMAVQPKNTAVLLTSFQNQKLCIFENPSLSLHVNRTLSSLLDLLHIHQAEYMLTKFFEQSLKDFMFRNKHENIEQPNSYRFPKI